MQLPYYLVHAFNADTRFTDLFAKQWRAEWAFYNSSLLNAGEQGRYGAGAGPTAAWCAGVGYKADLISSVPNAQTCRALGSRCLGWASRLPLELRIFQKHRAESERGVDLCRTESDTTVLLLPPSFCC